MYIFETRKLTDQEIKYDTYNNPFLNARSVKFMKAGEDL